MRIRHAVSLVGCRLEGYAFDLDDPLQPVVIDIHMNSVLFCRELIAGVKYFRYMSFLDSKDRADLISKQLSSKVIACWFSYEISDYVALNRKVFVSVSVAASGEVIFSAMIDFTKPFKDWARTNLQGRTFGRLEPQRYVNGVLHFAGNLSRFKRDACIGVHCSIMEKSKADALIWQISRFNSKIALEGTSKNGHRSSDTPDLPTNDSVLFSVRFCAVHPKNAGDCRLLQFFEVPLIHLTMSRIFRSTARFHCATNRVPQLNLLRVAKKQ